MLRFTLLGFPVTVHWMFWVVTAVLSPYLEARNPMMFQALIMWVLAVFLSILIHELGHTFFQRRFGARAQILLYSFGGLAIPDRGFTRKQDIIVSLAGPLVEIVLGLLLYEWLKPGPDMPFMLAIFVHSFYVVSVFWGVMNLLPIYPLDGGHVLLSFLGPHRQRTSYLVGAICAAAVAVFMLAYYQSYLNAFFFGALAWQNFQRSQGHRPPPFFMPPR